ncbi:MAG: hypothetical protein RIA69_08940 [Cyclobacteriaceae bacterium]
MTKKDVIIGMKMVINQHWVELLSKVGIFFISVDSTRSSLSCQALSFKKEAKNDHLEDYGV